MEFAFSDSVPYFPGLTGHVQAATANDGGRDDQGRVIGVLKETGALLSAPAATQPIVPNSPKPSRSQRFIDTRYSSSCRLTVLSTEPFRGEFVDVVSR